MIRSDRATNAMVAGIANAISRANARPIAVRAGPAPASQARAIAGPVAVGTTRPSATTANPSLRAAANGPSEAPASAARTSTSAAYRPTRTNRASPAIAPRHASARHTRPANLGFGQPNARAWSIAYNSAANTSAATVQPAADTACPGPAISPNTRPACAATRIACTVA